MEWQLLVGFATRGRWYHEIGDCAKTRQAKQALAMVSGIARVAVSVPLVWCICEGLKGEIRDADGVH